MVPMETSTLLWTNSHLSRITPSRLVSKFPGPCSSRICSIVIAIASDRMKTMEARPNACVAPAWAVSVSWTSGDIVRSLPLQSLRTSLLQTRKCPKAARIHAAAGYASDDDAAPEALQVLDMDVNLPLSVLPRLDAAAQSAIRTGERARKLHPTRCTMIAHTLTKKDASLLWAFDQAVYDTGCRLFVTSRDVLHRKCLDGRLPSDAKYWAILPVTTLVKRAERVVGMQRNSRDLVEMVGIIDNHEMLQALNDAASMGNTPKDKLPILLGSRSREKCMELARVVAEKYSSLRVAGVMFDASIAATVEDGIAAFVTDIATVCGEDAEGQLPRLNLVVGSDFAGSWREQLARPALHKKCRVVLYAAISTEKRA